MTKKIKILVTASTFPRSHSDDQSDFVLRQLSWISQIDRRLRFFVLAPHDKGAKTIERFGKVVVIRYRYFLPAALQRVAYPSILPNLLQNGVLWLQIPFLMVALLFQSLRFSKRLQVSLLYSHWFVPQGVVCATVAWFCKVPHVLTSHSSDVEIVVKIPIVGGRTARAILKSFSAITAVSKKAESSLVDCLSSIAKPQIYRLPMGVEPALFDMAVIPRSSRSLLFLGRLVQKKGVDILLRALAVLGDSDIMLTIAGSGPEQQPLIELQRKLRLEEQSRFTGFLSNEHKMRALEAASIMIVPSVVLKDGDTEGVPVSLLEGMASGLVVIASDESGACDVITDGVDGFIVKAGDVEDLARVIRQAIELSPIASNRITTAASNKARQFGWDRLAHKYQSILMNQISETF